MSLTFFLQEPRVGLIGEKTYALSKIRRYEVLKIWRYADWTSMFHGINCTLDTAIHDNFYSSYIIFSNNSVNDGFAPKEPCVWLYWIYITTYLRIDVSTFLRIFIVSWDQKCTLDTAVNHTFVRLIIHLLIDLLNFIPQHCMVYKGLFMVVFLKFDCFNF